MIVAFSAVVPTVLVIVAMVIAIVVTLVIAGSGHDAGG
jgi:hypothetical protein